MKGDGTKWLSERKVGDVLDVLGPLGHGFDVQALGDRPIFIGGGIGVPPMLGCVRTAVERVHSLPQFSVSATRVR